MSSSVLNHLACALGRRDEVPNKDLAILLAKRKDKAGAIELVKNLDNKDKNIQSDCIKTLDELSLLAPELVAENSEVFLNLLKSKNNRLQWGAMAVLDNLTDKIPETIYKNLVKIIEAMEKGSVITKDRGMSILIKLCAYKKHSDQAHELFLEQLLKSPNNQLPMYAEQAIPILTEPFRKRFIDILKKRLPGIEKASKQQRVEKVIKSVELRSKK